MNKFKKICLLCEQKFSRGSRKKRRILICISSAIIIIFIAALYYSIALARVSEAEVNLAALRESVNKEKICHEDCLVLRKKQETIIIAAIRKPEADLLKRLEKYWSSNDESFEFKKEIINLWRLNSNLSAVPSYIYDYLDNEEGDARLQSVIISSFLSPDKSKKWLDYYFSILASERDLSLKKEVLSALSNRGDKESGFTLKQLVFLKDLILNPETPVELKPDTVLLLADYYPLFAEDCALILKEIYKDKTIDNISRSFAGDILNKKNGNSKLILPAITVEEWEAYYN